MPKIHITTLPDSSDYERDNGHAPVFIYPDTGNFVGVRELSPLAVETRKTLRKKGPRLPKEAGSSLPEATGKKRPKTKFQSVHATFSVKVEAEEPVPVFFSQLPLGAMFRFCPGKLVRDAHPFGIKVGKTSYLYTGHDKVLNRKERVTKAEKVIELPATLHVQDRIAVARFGDPTIVPDTKESPWSPMESSPTQPPVPDAE